MLAMGRILTTGARILLLDEITEGLAPVIVEALGRAVSLLKSRGFTIVLVEQNFHFARHLADRHYVIEHGRVRAGNPRGGSRGAGRGSRPPARRPDGVARAMACA